ncbi:MAG: HlyD family secretion protein [Verrucomicrobiae bacterium]|nr:HlyD family secretion protein [Verrucomicrobiae bacterium]
MDFLLILTYAAICIGIFKLFRIPVNAISLLTATLGGVFLIGFLLLGMNYNHPFSSNGRFYYYTTPIVPAVSGIVVEAPVHEASKVKAGDVLFRIDPTRYQAAVDQKKAALAEAEQSVKQLTAARESAEARLSQAKADADRTRQAYERVEKMGPGSAGGGAVSQQEIDTKRGLYLAAEASASAAEAETVRARLAETSQIDGINTTVARLQAELEGAQYDLDQTIVRAPSNGTVEQTFLREGMMATAMPLRPVMVFRHDEEPVFGAAFLQNSAQRLIPGSHAEIAFPAVPGRIFQAKVLRVQEAIAQGQLQPSGSLVDPETIKGPGRVIVALQIEDPDLASYRIVPGTSGVVAVYTEHFHHLAVMRKVLIRMNSWMNYLFSDGH